MPGRQSDPFVDRFPTVQSARRKVVARCVSIAERGWHWPAAFFVVYAFLVRDVTVGRLYAFGDYPPFYGRAALVFFMETWHPQMLGFAQPVNTLSAYVGVMTFVGGVMAQNLFYLLLIPGCFLTFWIFLGRFVGTEPARTLGAAVYAVNPVTIGQFTNGGANELLALLGMPLVLYYLWETVERNAWLPALKAGAVFGATTIIPWTSFWILAPFATYLLYRTRHVPRCIAKLLAAGALGIVLTVPNLYYLLLRSESLSSTETLFEVIGFTYANATPLLVARLAGNQGSYAMQALGYNDDPALVIGLVIPIIGLVALKRMEARPFFAVAVAIIAFMFATRQGLTYPLFEALTPLFSLKNPNKLYYSLLVSAGVTFALGIEELVVGARNSRLTDLRGRSDAVVRTALIAVIVLSMVSYVAPASSGLGLAETRGDDYVIPEEYEEVATELDGRVLWLPYSYTTELRLRHVYPAHVGVRSGGVIDGRENAELVESIFNDFADDEPIDGRLRMLGVRYVVIDHLPQTRWNSHEGRPRMLTRNFAPKLFGDPSAIEERFEGDDNYDLAFRTDEFTVYRVVGAEVRDGTEQFQGLHRVYSPEEATTQTVGETLVTNAHFNDGLNGWWYRRGDDGTQTKIIDTDDGEHAALLTTTSGERSPIAQDILVTRGGAYKIDVDAEGPGNAILVWYDGENEGGEEVSRTTYPLSDLPKSVVAPGKQLSIRVRPDDEELLVRSVDVWASTYPPATGYSRSAGSIPGMSVDGRTTDIDVGSAVAVNLDDEAARAVGADVRIVDAETAIAGELDFDDTYRQGVGVLLPDGNLPSSVPSEAEVITHETENGTVLDYWIVGEFDQTPVTVRYTSYHEDWQGPPGSTHFRAFGWANGFTDADPDEIHWTGDTELRQQVLGAWLLVWIVVLVVLIGTEMRARMSRSEERGRW